MKIGVSTASLFCKMPLEEVFETIKSFGTELVEVFLDSYSEYDEDFARLLRCRMMENNLRAFSVHPLGTQFESQLFSIHDRQKADAVKVFEKVLRAGQILGASCYVMHGPAHLSGVAKNLQMERIIAVMNELMDIADGYGIQLALENVSYCVYHEPKFGRLLADGIGGHRLKFVLDIKQAVRIGVSPFEIIDAVGEDIINVHLCDYAIKGERIDLRMPGEGEFDFARFIKVLKDKGYKGNMFIEVYSDMYKNFDELRKSYQYLDYLCSQYE